MRRFHATLRLAWGLLRRTSAALFGRMSWEAPGWLYWLVVTASRVGRRLAARPGQTAGLARAIVGLAGGGVLGYTWWQARPGPGPARPIHNDRLRAPRDNREFLLGAVDARLEEGRHQSQLQPPREHGRAGEAHRAEAPRPVRRHAGRGEADDEVHDQLRQAETERLYPLGRPADSKGGHRADRHRRQRRGGGARRQGE